MTLEHAPLLHELYCATPSYFALLGSPVPSLHEVTRDVETALYDARRCLELLYQDGELIGSLDYKLNYPHDGDVTINLLLIRANASRAAWALRWCATWNGACRRVSGCWPACWATTCGR